MFLGHFLELRELADFVVAPQWRAVARVGRRIPGAAAVVIINTIGNDEGLVESRVGYGHYIAVRLEVDALGWITGFYADSLAGASDGRRRQLIARLVEQLVQHAQGLVGVA